MKRDASAQVSLRLPRQLLDRVEAEARRRKLDRSTLVRELLEAALSGGSPSERPWDRVSEMIGQYRLGVPDLGARHREHLARILRDRR